MNERRKHRLQRATLAYFCLVLWLIGGCGEKGKGGLTEGELSRIAVTQKIELVESAGGLVLMVGGEAITSDEIIRLPVELGDKFESPLENLKTAAQTSSPERFKVRARGELKSVVMNKISDILLYQEAKKQAGEGIDESLDKVAEKEVRKFVLSFGGDEAKADEALKKMGLDRKSFKERRKKYILTQSYLGMKMPRYRPATYREMAEYYERRKDELFLKPTTLQFRLIDIEPAKVDIADANQNRLEEARKLAQELLGRIKAGEDFGALAQQYSHGLRRESGGLWQPVQPESLANPYDILAAEAQKIEPGQVAGPIEAGEHIFIMKLEEKQAGGYEPFEKVQKQVEERILYEQRNDVVERLNAKLVEHAGLGKTDEFVDFCSEKIYQMNKQ
jgi:peptidyl-prolyl cis-trans isomerase SurA